MTVKERLLAAIRSEPVDHVPFVPRFWGDPRHERATWEDERERLAFFARHGWDTATEIWCSIRVAPSVQGEVFHEEDERGPVLRQVWHTPAGDITERLRATDDWPYAQTLTQPLGFLHDFRSARYIEVPFKCADDLVALPYLFPVELTPDDRDGFAHAYRSARALADEFDVAVFADLRPGLDWLIWLFPAQEAVLRTVDSPELIEPLLAHLSEVYRRRFEFLFELGIDGVIRSGWYESASLWSPDIFRRYVVPALEWEIVAAKASGAASVYLMDSGVEPLLADLDRLDFDCLAGIDPATAGGVDLASIRRQLPGKAIWGGISGPLHLGRGTPDEVESAVESAFAACGKTGFILGPVVGFRYDWPWENLEACDRAWRRLR